MKKVKIITGKMKQRINTNGVSFKTFLISFYNAIYNIVMRHTTLGKFGDWRLCVARRFCVAISNGRLTPLRRQRMT